MKLKTRVDKTARKSKTFQTLYKNTGDSYCGQRYH